MIGKMIWAIGDGFMNQTSNGAFDSHEAVCVLNVSDETAHIKLNVYFENAEPLKGFTAICEPERTNHIRLDKIVNDKGERIPYGVPYALTINSTTPIIVQHTRLDVTQAEMTLMTSIAFGV